MLGITPNPLTKIQTLKEKNRDIIIVKVFAGQTTPYYYTHKQTFTVFIRIGDETLHASNQQLNELILRGRNESYDALLTNYKKANFSSTLFEATYNIRIEEKDYLSFVMCNRNGLLTNAGLLLSD